MSKCDWPPYTCDARSTCDACGYTWTSCCGSSDHKCDRDYQTRLRGGQLTFEEGRDREFEYFRGTYPCYADNSHWECHDGARWTSAGFEPYKSKVGEKLLSLHECWEPVYLPIGPGNKIDYPVGSGEASRTHQWRWRHVVTRELYVRSRSDIE